MLRIYKLLFTTVSLILAVQSQAQVINDSIPVSINPKLVNIFQNKIPTEYTIAQIDVSGTKSFDPNLIVSISGLAIGDKVKIPGTDVFAKAIQKLWKQNLVASANVYFTKLVGNDLTILFEIIERPRLADFKIFGVSKGQKDDLEGKMQLAKDRVLTENMKLSALEAIHKFFNEKGYRNATVTVKEEESKLLANSVVISYYIDKGKKVRVDNINISSNEQLTDLAIKKQMKGTKEMSKLTLYPSHYTSPYGDSAKYTSFNEYLKQTGYLSISKTKEFLDPWFRFKLFSSAKFSEKKFAEDREKILNYYNSQGFRDAEIVDYALIDNKEKDKLYIDIKVKEGRKYYFGDLVWKGNAKYNDSILNYILNIKKGDIYNISTLNKRLGKELSPEGGDISSLYMDDGYLFFSVTPIETRVYNDTIDFELHMQEGPQAVYGKITVSGNDKTKDYVIIRELRTIPGERFSRSDIIRTQRELSQLQFFNAEKINPQITPNQESGTVDINWQVEEKSADQLELSAGFGGGIGLTGTLGVTFNNFSIKNIGKKSSWDPLPSGDGQKFSVRIQSNGKAYRSMNASFTEPWLGGKKRNSFTVSLYSTKYANSYNQFGYCRTCGDTSYIRTVGAGISLGKQLKWPDDYFNLIYSLNYQQYKLKNYGVSGFGGLTNGISNNISLKVALVRNSISNPLFPTSGSSFMLSGQFTLPYSLMGLADANTNQYKLPEYHKWRFNGEWYVPIGNARGAADSKKQFVLKAAAKYGFIGKYNQNLDVTPFERFQLGDAGLSNNFAILGYDIIAHRGYPIYSTSNPKVNPDNGTPSNYFTIFNKYTLEARYPFSTNASSTIYGLAFFEAANGWYKFSEYNPFKLRRSAGVGMRFFLPMFGLLGFDYGIGLDRYTPSGGLKGAAKFTFMLGQEPE